MFTLLRCVLLTTVVLTAFAEAPTVMGSAIIPFQPATAGCSMAHCDSSMSDRVGLLSPSGPEVRLLAHDWMAPGAGIGLGCSSNGTIAVCSYKSTSGDAVVAYSADGTRLWTSRGILNSTAYTSAPMVDPQGTVIAADSKRIIRFTPKGKVMWSVFTPGGYPISPVQTASGALVLATANGPLSVYDPALGVLVGSQYLWQDASGGAFYETVNTPCVAGNRLYISTQLTGARGYGRLYAVDVDVTKPDGPLTVAWFWDFGGPSGASPTCKDGTVFFDVNSPLPDGTKSPSLVALTDTGNSPSVAWLQPVPNSILASTALDPRGGLWVNSLAYARLERRSESTGLVMDSLSLVDLIGDGNKYVPSSALSVTGTNDGPVLTLGVAQSGGSNAFVVCIDLVAMTLRWKYPLSPGAINDKAAGQFPVVTGSGGQPIVVFSGYYSGAYFVATQ